ncbi:hypothetical protein SLS60_002378 [Paraconiothyrium brasiliense]|uniref:Uncharacterized protein n=1 Tax=Paraconiothyrium brasiliense TaxID=300254 RepID=A0ABR3S2N0_9PLEO
MFAIGSLQDISLAALIFFVILTHAQDSIPVYPITNVDPVAGTGYFSDPFHVPYQNSKDIYISGTTHQYLECNNSLQSECASLHRNEYNNSQSLIQAAGAAGTTICSAAGIHPYQTGSGASRSWDAVVTLHVQNTTDCDGISGWSVIVHAHPQSSSGVEVPPTSWIGDKVLVGSFSERVDANYDGKYFQTPGGQLYLVYQKQVSKQPKRDGVVAWPMDSPTTKTPGSNPTVLLLPHDDMNSENYVAGDPGFKLIETGNMRAVNGKFLMAYSVGAFNHKTYKLGIAYSDTFLPAEGQQYRKVMKNNPDHLWNSQNEKEIYYLLQADEKHDGWHYIGDQVLAPGVPTVSKIGANDGWVLTFAGYDPQDAPMQAGTNKFLGNHRRPYFINLDVKVPVSPSVEQANDTEMQNWITPVHG